MRFYPDSDALSNPGTIYEVLASSDAINNPGTLGWVPPLELGHSWGTGAVPCPTAPLQGHFTWGFPAKPGVAAVLSGQTEAVPPGTPVSSPMSCSACRFLQ